MEISLENREKIMIGQQHGFASPDLSEKHLKVAIENNFFIENLKKTDKKRAKSTYSTEKKKIYFKIKF